METMLHPGGQPQRGEATIAVELCKRAITSQIFERIPGTLYLEQICTHDRPGRPNNGITRTDQHFGVSVDRPRSLLEFANETLAQACEILFLRLT